MKLTEIQSSLELYDSTLEDFVNGYRLPMAFFTRPDHFAVKCADQIDYFDTCSELADEVDPDGIWELELDSRFLASAKLAGKVSIWNKMFEWVEIMQPRPGKEIENGFVEHTEFFYPDFFRVEEVLNQKGVDYELQQNPGHKWINIVLDKDGREVKFNDKSLAEVLIWEHEQGLLHPVGREG